jgi:hypothetical protein
MSHDHEDSREVVAKKEKEWTGQQELMGQLLTQGAKHFFSQENMSGIEDSFVEKKDQVCCMDEGTAHIDDGENKLAMAGSGILFPATSWDERLERVADLYIQSGVYKITSHEGCGAAGLAWKRDGEKAGTGFDNPDDYGKAWVRDLERVISQKLQAVGKEIKVSAAHVNSGEMVRPKEFHSARAVWFDATGKFNPHLLEGKLPKGFLIDFHISNDNGVNDEEKEYPFVELRVAVNIALGDHG